MEKDDNNDEFLQVDKKYTDLPVTVWIEQPRNKEMRKHKFLRLRTIPREDRSNYTQACDIIFDRNGNIIEIVPNKNNKTISKKLFNLLQKWIQQNIKYIIKYWYGKFDSFEFLEAQVSITGKKSKNILQNILNKLIRNHEEGFELTSLPTEYTGIGFMIWAQCPPEYLRWKQRNIHLRILTTRTKFSKYDDSCDVTYNRRGRILQILPSKNNNNISNETKKNLQKWIYKNIRLLVKHWSFDNCYSTDMWEQCKSIKRNEL